MKKKRIQSVNVSLFGLVTTLDAAEVGGGGVSQQHKRCMEGQTDYYEVTWNIDEKIIMR